MGKQRIRVGVNAAIVRDESILLVEFDDETGRHCSLPEGSVEAGESLHQAVRREVREETGAEVGVSKLARHRRLEQRNHVQAKTHASQSPQNGSSGGRHVSHDRALVLRVRL